jgi:Phosphotransferase enzyme family
MSVSQLDSPLDVDALGRGLAEVFGSKEPLRVLDRAPNSYASTFPSEIVTCAVGAEVLELFCKYELAWARDVNGSPAGVVYEAEVYRLAVEPARLPAPRFYGLATDPDTGTSWLVVEHLRGTLRVAKAPDPQAITRAAQWLGEFHRFHESTPSPAGGRINRHDRRYFTERVHRALEHSRPLEAQHPWFPRVAECFEAELVDLLLETQTIIHGDFYPENVLTRDGRVYPIDWASAARSAGEIDLAALTEGHWEEEAVQAATSAYAHARWASEPGVDFAARVTSATMWLHFRALGHSPSAPFVPGAAWRFEQMHQAAKTFGI